METMQHIHFMQQWFTLSEPAMEEALHDMPLFRDFTGLGGWCDRLPDETTILRFRHLLENNKLAAEILKTLNDLLHSKGLLLKASTVVDATLIAAPSRIGLVHTVRRTSGNVNDVVQANALLHGQETKAFADAGYQGVDKRDAADPEVRWNVAMRPGRRKGLDKTKTVGQLKDRLEKLKVSIRAKVEHPFRLIKRLQTAVCVRPPRRRD